MRWKYATYLVDCLGTLGYKTSVTSHFPSPWMYYTYMSTQQPVSVLLNGGYVSLLIGKTHILHDTYAEWFLQEVLCKFYNNLPIHESFHTFQSKLSVNTQKVCVCTASSYVKQLWFTSSVIQLTHCRPNFLLNFIFKLYKMWIIQEPKRVTLWNKWHFEEEKMESVQHV
jgi:hypothetical protein